MSFEQFKDLFLGGDSSPLNSVRSPDKFRVSESKSLPWTQESRLYGMVQGVEQYTPRVQTLQSYLHPFKHLGRSSVNIGGSFYATTYDVTDPGSHTSLKAEGRYWKSFSGTLAPSFTSWNRTVNSTPVSYEGAVNEFQNTLTPREDLTAFGATAVSQCAPTNPLVDLSTTAAELLREGLPSIPGRNLGNIGGEYLNYMFGLSPLVGDLTDLRRVVTDHDKLIKDYERKAGRWMRRRFSFNPIIDSQVEKRTDRPVAFGKPLGGMVRDGRHTTRIRTETNMWFSGAFTYYLPKKGWRRTVAELDHLYGIRPGLDTVWQLTAYSWLVDYFSNIGDVVSNINSFTTDGLVMPYGYIMCHQTMNIQEDWLGELLVDGEWVTTRITSEHIYQSKQRQLANPFGFGIPLDGLTDRQWTILAALGYSRARG